MKKIWLFILISPALFITCKQKKKENSDKDSFFPALSFIKSQVAHVDTSLYSIRKINYVDSTKTDTAFFPREEFKNLAADFLRLPDLSEPKYKNRFTEKNSFDTLLKLVILTLEPINPEKEEIQRQEVLIRPSNGGNDKVTSIIIDYITNNKDSSVQKRLLWQVDKSFLVTKTWQFPGQPETTTTYKVIWNDEDNE